PARRRDLFPFTALAGDRSHRDAGAGIRRHRDGGVASLRVGRAAPRRRDRSHRGVRAAVAGGLSARDRLQRPHGTHPSPNSFFASAPVIEATASGFSPAAATILAGSSPPIGDGISEPIIPRPAPLAPTTKPNPPRARR